MCKYCKIGNYQKIEMLYSNNNITENWFFLKLLDNRYENSGDMVKIGYHTEEDKWYLIRGESIFSKSSDTIEIKYCPFCGDLLKGDK
ncbi:MAG: hypothetical protein J6S85_01040 [Methanobrevibacter sp.]|nr:hypothetical protein [Methanobrevibacter sp.]MBO7712117.1 hypothetical protein [Methanobrevibacter sp.]